MFGKKSKMEKAVALDDDFDLDLDFDEDFSFDFDDGVSAENKKARASRTPIMNATLDVGQGLKKATLSKSGMEAILKGVLPPNTVSSTTTYPAVSTMSRWASVIPLHP